MIRWTQLASKSFKPTHSTKSLASNLKTRSVMFNPMARNITSIQKYKPGFIFYKLKKMFRTRASLYKLLMLSSVVQLAYFGIKTYSAGDSTILCVMDLLSREDIKDDDTFKLVIFSKENYFNPILVLRG